MTTQEKIAAILAAIDAGRTSANKLEPTRRGATVAKLRAGKTVKDETVDRLYARLLEVTEVTGATEEVIEIESITAGKEKSMIEVLEQRVAALESENRELRERLEIIEKSIPASIPESIPESIPVPSNVLGFSLAQSSKGHWYAVRRIRGTQYSVYIGRDKRSAEAKIRAWIERKGIEA